MDGIEFTSDNRALYNKYVYRLYRERRKLSARKSYLRSNKAEYYTANKGKILAYTNKYHSERLKIDTDYRLYIKFRSRLNKFISEGFKLPVELGIDERGFRAYFESKFEPGMNWDNRSDWRIKLLIPYNKFKLSDPEQAKICFNYLNIRPDWKPSTLRAVSESGNKK